MPPNAISLGSTRYNKTGSWRSQRPIIHEENCISCMICWKFCPDVAITAESPPKIDYVYCKGCGICAEECPQKCIDIVDEVR